jgi:ketosteroid isomerase-like protein
MSTAGVDTVAFDRRDVVAEVLAAFHRYEDALAAGDVDVLVELFWDDPRCVRFGVADRQQGADAITRWRQAHPGVPAGRRLHDTHVLAIGEHTAMVTTLFSYPDGAVEGRQSQTWVRFGQGWRVVAAHVSEVPRA